MVERRGSFGCAPPFGQRVTLRAVRVHCIQTGTVAIKTRQRRGQGQGTRRLLNTVLDREWTQPLPIYAWAIEHPEGIIVVDAGETARVAEPGYFPRWHLYFRVGVKEWVEPKEEIGPQLEALGIAPTDVRWLVLTHLHTDHAGGLHHFPNSEVLVSRKEFDNAKGSRGKVRGFLPHRWPSWFSPRLIDFRPEPFGPFPESLALTEAGDVHLVPTGGHTPGHLSVVLEEEEGSIFFAGDASYTEELMLEGAVDGVSPDEEAARQTLERVRAYAQTGPTIYLPSHDPGSAERLATRRAVNVEPAATAGGKAS